MRKIHRRTLLRSKIKRENLFKFTMVSDFHIDIDAIDNEEYPNLSSPPMYYYTIGKKLDDVIAHVNLEKPAALINLGDIIEGPNPMESFDYFMSKWNTIGPSIKTSISAGNHDYTARVNNNELGLTNHEYVSYKLGYGNNPYIAGSKMNESFAVYDKGLGVRFINFDTNRIEDGSFTSSGSFLSDEVIDWMKSELLSCPERVAFVYSHRGRDHLETQSRTKLENMAQQVLVQRPDLKLYGLYGHTHRPDLWRYEDVANFPIYNSSALVDNLESEFYTFYLSEAGIHSIDKHWAEYP